jgi:hypothetical protein
MTPARRQELLMASRLGRLVSTGTEVPPDQAPPPAHFAAPPAGRDGDLDPAGHWRTIQGQPVHITSDGAVDAGGHPALRKVLAEKAGLPDRTGAEKLDNPPPAGNPLVAGESPAEPTGGRAMTGTETGGVRSNSRAQGCERCGVTVAPGHGRLDFVPDAHDVDEFDRVGTGREKAHWTVTCHDAAGCAARVKEAADRRDAERAAKREAARAEAAKVAAAKAEKRAAWDAMTAGLVRSEAAPEGVTRTGEHVDGGLDAACEKLKLADGSTGWLVSWIGDMDGHYYLLPPTAAADAEAEKARLHRVYQWWRPGGYKADSYPGPGVPEADLTPAERAEVETRRAEKYAAYEAKWRRWVDLAVKPVDTAVAGGKPNWTKGCRAWQVLAAAGVDVRMEPADPVALAALARADADLPPYSPERDKLSLEVVLRATLPPAAKNKNGTVKAAFERKLPRDFENKTSDRFIKVRIEYD